MWRYGHRVPSSGGVFSLRGYGMSPTIERTSVKVWDPLFDTGIGLWWQRSPSHTSALRKRAAILTNCMSGVATRLGSSWPYVVKSSTMTAQFKEAVHSK